MIKKILIVSLVIVILFSIPGSVYLYIGIGIAAIILLYKFPAILRALGLRKDDKQKTTTPAVIRENESVTHRPTPQSQKTPAPSKYKIWSNCEYQLFGSYSHGLFYQMRHYHIIEFVDGRKGVLKVLPDYNCNYTVVHTRKVADIFGYKYDSKTKREALGFELVTKYGDGKWAFKDNMAVRYDGVTYELCERSTLYNPEVLAYATGQINYDRKKFVDRYEGEPFKVEADWTEEDILKNLAKFIDTRVEKKKS